ncbi:signal peptidase II [uncultured Tateyamaria sp.]|uniref:signal peptidase II n=1 Tax=uncultured Tateyamaria sp. TaxID=455651 RepID=UPI0026068B96|nr:signal peptidase II [uncultured Tateyamaria sp.]
MKLLWISAAIAFVLDQASKYVVIHVMGVSQFNPINVFPPLLNFRYGENRGINFGLFGDGASVWALIAVALVICAGVLWWVWKHPQGRLACASAGLLIGGALANVLDRVLYGFVLDFLNMSCCGIANPFVFNVADIFIFAGAIGLVFFGQEGASRKKGA